MLTAATTIHITQDAKIITELTKERPYLQFLSEKAVTVLDDTFQAVKEQLTAPDPAEFRRRVKEGLWGSDSAGVD